MQLTEVNAIEDRPIGINGIMKYKDWDFEMLCC